MDLDCDRISDREDLEGAIAVLRDRRARAQTVQPIEHERAKRILREAAAKTVIAAVASVHELPLGTRNPDDCKGLESVPHVIAVQASRSIM